jgi:hypothetical protein
MSPMCCICLRKIAPLLSCAMLCGLVASIHADPKPLSKAEQAKVEKAIDKGVAFLKGAQTKQGDWQWKMYKDKHFVGQCALPAYALLESGVTVDDPVIQKAAEYIRPRVLTNDQTYELSLAILFFDRLGNPKDKRLIQTLALRLIAGQHYTGGWSYDCPTLNEKNERDLLKSLEALNKRIGGGKKTRDKALEGMEIPQLLQPLAVFQRASSLSWQEPPEVPNGFDPRLEMNRLLGRTDNSNTQFSMLGLWAAQRHGIPLQATFEIMVQRFEYFQLYPSGIWMYRIDATRARVVPKQFEIDRQYKRSMTCVGLMGLAIGRGLHLPTPGLSAGTKKDVHVLRGLAALRTAIGKPVGRMSEQIRPFPDLYFLWSLERVGMLYDLPTTIGGKEWYRWGAEALVTNQSRKGWWQSTSKINYRATMSTAFALLFLKRSHPMKDLTPKLPFTAKELNEGIAHLRPDDKFPVHGGPPLERSTVAPSRSTKPDP